MGILSNIFNLIVSGGRYSVTNETSAKIKSEWEKIDDLIKQKGPSQLRQALISADRSLDTALKDISSFETMGERLKNTKDRFDRTTYDKIWKAHKVRNTLVHEAGYEPPYYVLIEAINALKEGIKQLGVNL